MGKDFDRKKSYSQTIELEDIRQLCYRQKLIGKK